jgi:hypothetical protein
VGTHEQRQSLWSRWREWRRYRRFLAALLADAEASGYKVSPQEYGRLKGEARKAARRTSD